MDYCLGNRRFKELVSRFAGTEKTPHAVLIEGDKGLGRTVMARYLAMSLVCGSPPCLACNSCKRIMADAHPDVTLWGGGSGKSSFHIDEIRRIREMLSLSSNESSVRVYILLDCEGLTVQAQNALLKSIEEPPFGVYFILTALSRRALLPTLISRLTVITAEPLDDDTIKMALYERFPDVPCDRAVCMSKGNLGRALLLMSEDTSGADEAAERIVSALVSGSEYSLYKALYSLRSDRGLFIAALSVLSHKVHTALHTGTGEFSFMPVIMLSKLGFLCLEGIRMLEQNASLPLTAARFVIDLKKQEVN